MINNYFYGVLRTSVPEPYNTYKLTNTVSIFNTNNFNNDKKFMYIYKINVSYKFNNREWNQTMYIKGTVRQNLPQFNSEDSKTKWQYTNQSKYYYIDNWGPYERVEFFKKDQYDDESNTRAHNVYKMSTFKLPNSDTQISPPNTVRASEQWNNTVTLNINDFDFDTRSIASKQWACDPSNAYLACSKPYTSDSYSYQSLDNLYSFYNSNTILSQYDNFASRENNKLSQDQKIFWQNFKDGNNLVIQRYVSTPAMPGIYGVMYYAKNDNDQFNKKRLVLGLNKHLYYQVSNAWGTVKTKYITWTYADQISGEQDLTSTQELCAFFATPNLLGIYNTGG